MDCKRPDDLQCSTTPNIDVALLMESLSRVAAGIRHCMEAVGFGKEDERLPTVLVAVVPGKPIQVIDVDEFQEYLPCFGESDSITAAPDDIGLLMSYDKLDITSRLWLLSIVVGEPVINVKLSL